MARQLSFIFEDGDHSFFMEKVDRDKLYGRVESHPVDPNGNTLQKGYLDEWGCVVIAQTGMGYLSNDQQWVDSTALAAFDAEGNPLAEEASSFDQPIVLQITPIGEFLDREVTAAYALKSHDQAKLITACEQLDGLYSFPFLNRKGYLPSQAFLLNNDQGLFMAVTQETQLELLSKPQRAAVDEFGDDDDDDDDDLDFGMF